MKVDDRHPWLLSQAALKGGDTIIKSIFVS